MIRIKILFVTCALLALPAGAHATETLVAPPFDRAHSAQGCLRLVPGEIVLPGCTSSANARVDGSLDLAVDVETLHGGTVPGPAGGYAATWLVVSSEVPAVTARVLIYTVTLHVERAEATAAAGAVGSAGDSSATMGTYVSIGDHEAYGRADIVESGGGYAPTSREDEDVIVSMVVGDGVRRVYGGTGQVSIDVQGGAYTNSVWLGPQGGKVGVTVDARVTAVTLEVIE